MARLSAAQIRHLKAVAAYEARYHKRMGDGHCKTNATTLNALASRGLLSRQRGDYGLRWWYGLTEAGREALEEVS
jgi:DNA-binding PadR family transcriptional regulator